VSFAQYQATASTIAKPILIKGVTILTMTHGTVANGSVLIENGKIKAAGPTIPVPPNADIIDTRGKFLLPRLIKPYSHTGIYPLLGFEGNVDLSEAEGNFHS
jgi:imidazolonepropionase-like amidohydrolase